MRSPTPARDRALVVVLTGTDLYGGIDATARRSLDLATRLVVLNELGIDALPARWRPKAELILPSAAALARLAPRRRTFDVAVVGHLRAVKDPRLPMNIARHLPQDSRIRFLHAGAGAGTRMGARGRRHGDGPPNATAGSAAFPRPQRAR